MEEARRRMIRTCLSNLSVEFVIHPGRKFVSRSDDKLFHKAVDFLKSNPVNPIFAAAAAAARRSYWANSESLERREQLISGKTFSQGTFERATKITSDMIQTYVVNIPDLKVEDVVSNFKNMHIKLDLTPSCAAYEKLIIYCCDSHEVHEAFDLVDEMIDLGLPFSLDTLHYILKASSEKFCSDLAYRTYSVMSRCNLKPNSRTFWIMLDLCVKVKNYDGAFSLLWYLEEKDMFPTAAMYYAIMRRHYGEPLIFFENSEEMNEADIEPDQFREYQETLSHQLDVLDEKMEADIDLDDQTRDYQESLSRQLDVLDEKMEADLDSDDQTCDYQENMSCQLENLEENKEADIKLDDDQTCDDQENLPHLLEVLEEVDIELDDQTCNPLLRNY